MDHLDGVNLHRAGVVDGGAGDVQSVTVTVPVIGPAIGPVPLLVTRTVRSPCLEPVTTADRILPMGALTVRSPVGPGGGWLELTVRGNDPMLPAATALPEVSLTLLALMVTP